MVYKRLFLLIVLSISFLSHASEQTISSSSKTKAVLASFLFIGGCAGTFYFTRMPDRSAFLGPLATCLGVASFVLPTALVYEIGKRGYISHLTNYLKKGECRSNFSWMSLIQGKRSKVKIGIDFHVWGFSMFVSAGIWKLLPKFEKYNKEWVFGTMMFGQLAANVWAQQTVLPVKYNPFVWEDEQGKSESVLIFLSKWGKLLTCSNGEIIKKLNL